MFANLAMLSLAVLSTSTPRDPSFYRPRVELWTNRGDGAVYTRGERVRLYFRLDQDAYVTIFRVDTDGRIRVLFPRDPWEDNFARGGRDYQVDGNQLGRWDASRLNSHVRPARRAYMASTVGREKGSIGIAASGALASSSTTTIVNVMKGQASQ